MARDGTVSRCNRRTVSHRVAGAARRLPSTHLSTDELMSATRHNTHIDLERLTGIRERRVSIGDEDSFSLATAAAQTCLDKARCAADRSTSSSAAVSRSFAVG